MDSGREREMLCEDNYTDAANGIFRKYPFALVINREKKKFDGCADV
jgi:hypothetical protein